MWIIISSVMIIFSDLFLLLLLLFLNFNIIFCFQDARKGVLFLDFPPVLQLQLKRFEYDYMRDTMVKVRTLLNTAIKMINHFCTSLSLLQADRFF